jgi:hypothetical protein
MAIERDDEDERRARIDLLIEESITSADSNREQANEILEQAAKARKMVKATRDRARRDRESIVKERRKRG